MLEWQPGPVWAEWFCWWFRDSCHLPIPKLYFLQQPSLYICDHYNSSSPEALPLHARKLRASPWLWTSLAFTTSNSRCFPILSGPLSAIRGRLRYPYCWISRNISRVPPILSTHIVSNPLYLWSTEICEPLCCHHGHLEFVVYNFMVIFRGPLWHCTLMSVAAL